MEHDAVIIAWKEKVNFDLIRSMSVIIKQWSGDITSWAPSGIREFPAKDFEAYRRVMPHSEYVSGTSCLFKSMEEYVISYTKNLGFTGAFPISVKRVGVGESKVEGITGNGFFPSSPVQLTYLDITAMSLRLDSL